jgi:hypothetical protein
VQGDFLAFTRISNRDNLHGKQDHPVEGEWGRVEEITGTYVVLKLWERRLIVPRQWFIEHPFQNWTRTSAQIHQSVFLFLDYAMPIVAVTDTTDHTIKVRVLVSARAAGPAFDLGCKVREALLAFVSREYPTCLPHARWAGAPEKG